MQKITIYELAKELGMTPSMVSRALSPTGKVREEKRALVLKAAKKHGFVPNSFASRLSMKAIRIGIVIRSVFPLNRDKMLCGIKRAYEKLKDYKFEYDLTIIDIENETEKNVREAVMKYVESDGVIVSGFSAEKYSDILREFLSKNPNLVQVQAVNEKIESLFSSKHDENLAACLAADVLSMCLKKSERKNILLFTGDTDGALHARAAKAFGKACLDRGLCVVGHFDMKDDRSYFEENLHALFEKYGSLTDGIYITSGMSLPLCRYLEKNGIDTFFVAFDIYDEIKDYMKKGLIDATLSQDVEGQMERAVSALALYLIKGEVPPKTVFSDVRLVLPGNLYMFDRS